jgi:hypothetical protein
MQIGPVGLHSRVFVRGRKLRQLENLSVGSVTLEYQVTEYLFEDFSNTNAGNEPHMFAECLVEKKISFIQMKVFNPIKWPIEKGPR